jgi:hypothetical protein
VITSEISLTPYVRAVADLRWNLQLPEQDCLSDRARLALEGLTQFAFSSRHTCH